MVYHYEALNEQSFQKLAQALIVAEHPDTQCLPVAQPDGGRDAFRLHSGSDGRSFTVFQVKYTRDPEQKSARDLIERVIASEQRKLKNLIDRGATEYCLITNVRGTAHLDRGSIDRASESLANALQIRCQI